MNKRVNELFATRDSSDRNIAYEAFVELMKLAGKPVEWSYEVWDEMISELTHKDGHKRAYAAQMLARLANSDPEKRILNDFPKLAAVMRDEKTVTARHTLQSIWRVGMAGPQQRAFVIEALTLRFQECSSEKNVSLVRTDVITSLGKLLRETGGPAIAKAAEELMSPEMDGKAQKAQRASWRKASA